MITLRMMLASLIAGLAFMGFGTALSNRRDVRESDLGFMTLVLKGLGLALMSYTMYVWVTQRMA